MFSGILVLIFADNTIVSDCTQLRLHLVSLLMVFAIAKRKSELNLYLLAEDTN
jgi:hypothetical protein